MSEPAASPSPPVPDPAELARLFPAYRIEGLIGAGRSGAVYKARQMSLDRDVAIKVLPHEFTIDAGYHARFSASVMAMARLNHPNLISIYDFGEAEGLLFVIMEFVLGKSLFHSARDKAISSKEAATIVAGVCDGLAQAHENGIIHRNLNPGNILLTQKAQPKIGDFDIARSHGEDQPESFPYTAPELFSNPEHADARADIFAVGTILHELLTGQLPNADPRPPSAIIDCDPRFDIIVLRAAHPSPEMRFPDAATLGRELREILDTLPSDPKLRTVAAAAPVRPLPPPRMLTMKPSSSTTVPWMIAIIVLILSILVFLILSRDSAPSSPAKTSRRTVSTESNVSKPTLPEKQKPEIHPAPDPYAKAPTPEPDDPKPTPDTVDETPESDTEPLAEPEPADTDRIANTLTPLREKARELVTKALDDRNKALDTNARNFMWDLDVWFRKINNKAQTAWRPHIGNLKLKVENNRVPEQINPEDGINLSERMAEIASRAAEKQKEIDADFDLKLKRIRDGYLKHLATQFAIAEDSGQSGLAREIMDSIKEAKIDAEALPGVLGIETAQPPNQ